MSASVAGRPPRVLLADDNPVVSDVVRRYLERDGVEVEMVTDGAQALAALDAAPGESGADLVILDVMMPILDGLSVLRTMRSGPHRRVPVILLTALGEEEDRVVGFESGADDYVTKPFSPRELALRVASVLRRTTPAPTGPEAEIGGDASAIIRDGPIVLDIDARTVTVAGRPVSMTKREFDLLGFFLAHPGVVFSREQLLSEVWAWTFGDMSTVTVHVKRLRAKLGAAASLETVWGQGYRWDRST